MLPLMKRSVQGRKSSLSGRKSSFPRRQSSLSDVNRPFVDVNLESDLRLGKLDSRFRVRLFIHGSDFSSRKMYFSPAHICENRPLPCKDYPTIKYGIVCIAFWNHLGVRTNRVNEKISFHGELGKFNRSKQWIYLGTLGGPPRNSQIFGSPTDIPHRSLSCTQGSPSPASVGRAGGRRVPRPPILMWIHIVGGGMVGGSCKGPVNQVLGPV